jgi:hypothetical protein
MHHTHTQKKRKNEGKKEEEKSNTSIAELIVRGRLCFAKRVTDFTTECSGGTCIKTRGICMLRVALCTS